MNRPINTLFMIMSLDGKISTGNNDNMDFDKDIPNIPYAKDGIRQYYDYEQTTDLYSFGSGKIFSKLGINEAKNIKKTPVNFIIVDNHHLTLKGIENLIIKSNQLYLITKNKNHPAFYIKSDNLKIIYFENNIDFKQLFGQLKSEYAVERITIQTGGTINTQLIREGLIDYIDLFIAPILVGGKDTPSLMDGPSLSNINDLDLIKSLNIIESTILDNSYVHLKYEVIKQP